MSSASTPASRLKKLIKELPDQHDVLKTLKALQGEDTHNADRATAIIGGSFLESALETLILSRLIHNLGKDGRLELFDGERGAPLGSFSARIKMAYALGIYGPKTRDHLNNIRAIRNAFAHSSAGLTFNTKEVSDAIESLTLYNGHRLDGPGPIRTPKERFIAHVVWLFSGFEIAAIRNYSETQEILSKWRDNMLV
jgi:hypothetical protein